MIKSFREKDFYYPCLIWIIIVFWYLIFVYNFFAVSRHKTQDFLSSQAFYILSRPSQEAKDIVVVAIDESSRKYLNLKWPWPRSITAQLIKKIASSSPKVIGLDIVFSGQSRESEDEELIRALENHPNIILGYKLGEGTKDLPLPEFREAAKAAGFVNRPVDEGKILRNIGTFYVNSDGSIDFSIDVEIVASYLDISHRDIEVDLEKGVFLGDEIFIPSQEGLTPLNYLVHYNEFNTIGASLVLEGKVEPSLLKDKIVLVGATDPLIHDEHLTPLGIFSGVAILGNSLVMILSERFIYNLPMWQTFFIILIFGILILFINKKMSFGLASIFTFLIFSFIFAGSLYLRSKDIQLDYFSLFFLCFCSYVVTNIYKYTYLRYMRNKLKELAIRDPLTGFFTLRYFSLKLDEELRGRVVNLTFLTLIVSNYRRLCLDLNFEELKSLIKLLAGYVQSEIEKRFNKVDFARISQDIIGVCVWREEKEDVEGFFREFLEKLNQFEFKVEDKKVKFPVKGILIHKDRDKKIYAGEIIYNMESLLKKFKKDSRKNYISTDLEEKLWERKKEPREDILDFLAADLEERNKELERNLKELLESKKETEKAYLEAIRSLINALEEKDTYTQGHSERVANYAKKIAQQVGLSDEEIELIYKAALLHDIGKIGLPDYLLHKKGKLTREEVNLIRRHEIISVDILRPVKPFKDLLPIILHHHEHMDGTGYPHGLSGDMIPKGAQILAVADAFDAITSGRGYKRAKDITKAIQELEKCDKQYNSKYIEALRKVLKI